MGESKMWVVLENGNSYIGIEQGDDLKEVLMIVTMPTGPESAKVGMFSPYGLVSKYCPDLKFGYIKNFKASFFRPEELEESNTMVTDYWKVRAKMMAAKATSSIIDVPQ
jgi:hypothetical protein